MLFDAQMGGGYEVTAATAGYAFGVHARRRDGEGDDFLAPVRHFVTTAVRLMRDAKNEFTFRTSK
ncbi:MAG: hypothetical protein ACLRM8_10010 [Alistipes sp.]